MEQLRLINDAIFPIVYSDSFYRQVKNWGPQYCKFAVFNDLTVGSICCKVMEGNIMYIMTLGVLEAYRRIGIGSKLLDKVSDIINVHESREGNKKIKKIQLHVHTNNEVAIKFYERHSFKNVKTEKGYYEKIEVKDAFVLEREIGKEPEKIEEKKE